MSANSKGGIMQPLNPADYFTLAMDDEIRRDNLSGSLCVFALELDRRPDIESLVHRIEEFTRKFPLSLASLQAQGKKFYWCKRIKPEPVFFNTDAPKLKAMTFFNAQQSIRSLTGMKPGNRRYR